MMMKPGHCASPQRSVRCTILAIVRRQLRIAQHLSTSWATDPYCLNRLAFKQKFSLTHSTGSCSCQVIGTLVWTSYSPSIKSSGRIFSNLCGITLHRRGYRRTWDNATIKHLGWSNIPTTLFLHIYCVPTSPVTFLDTTSESMMFLQVICFVTLCLITRRF